VEGEGEGADKFFFHLKNALKVARRTFENFDQSATFEGYVMSVRILRKFFGAA